LEAVSGVVRRLLNGLGLEDTLRGEQVLREWPEIAGPRLARRARAVEIRAGTLWVEVEGSAWMHEVGFLKHELLKRIDGRLGAGVVRDIRLVLPRGGIQR
jgi:predicted nucleic acid-binding Zn ribbon protein